MAWRINTVVFLLVLYGLSTWFACLVGASESTPFYVTPTPGPNPDCPEGYPCHTLDEYALNTDRYFNSSNVSLIFLGGIHNLSHDFELINRTDVSLLGLYPPVTINWKEGHGIEFKVHSFRLVNVSVHYSGLSVPAPDISLSVLSILICGSEFNGSSLTITHNGDAESAHGNVTMTGISSMNSVFSINLYMYRKDTTWTITVKNCDFTEQSELQFMLETGPATVCVLDSGFSNSVLTTNSGLDSGSSNSVLTTNSEKSVDVHVFNCTFHNSNNARYPYLLGLDQEAAGSVLLQKVSFTDNQLPSSGGSIVSLIDARNVTIADCVFMNNTGTPIVFDSREGSLFVSGTNKLTNNRGLQGGGISLIESQLVFLSSNTTILFEGNYADAIGGALFVVTNPKKRLQCFYRVAPHLDNVQLVFVNNSARMGGYEVYGAALHDDCKVSGYSPSYEVYEKYFNFKESLRSLSRISSDAKRVCLCNDTGPVCDRIDQILVPSREVYPGERFNVSAVVVGDEFGTLTSTVYATFLGGPEGVALGSQQDSQTVKFEECNNLTYSLHSEVTMNGTLLLKVDQTTINKYGNAEQLHANLVYYWETGVIQNGLLTTPVYLSFTLADCPLGFEIDSCSKSCECAGFLKNIGFSNCSIVSHKGLVYRSGTQWIGQQNDTKVLVSQHCPFGYCSPEVMPVAFDKVDHQCINNRSGLLCGECQGNFSLILGSSECRKCENDYYLALLLVFALAGILLVLLVKLLNLTVAVGMINGMLFYANIVWANKDVVFLSTPVGSVFGDILQVFLAWTNLDFGISTCFFIGMNAVSKTSLQIIFPLYIWALAGMIILISKYSIKASQFFGNNTVPLLATLFLISYSKILRFVIKIFSFTYVYYPKGSLVVWTEDGNVPYLSPAHCALFAVALLCLLCLWAPFMLTLLFIQPLRRFDHYWPLRWINKWKPLFDSYTGPLKDKHHYWIGVLLLARGVIVVTSATTILPRVNLLATAIVAAIVGLPLKVYKKWPLAILEKSFVLNLLLLSAGLLYIDIVRDTVSKAAIAYTSATVVFLQFIGIVFAHFIIRVKELRDQRKLKTQTRLVALVNDHEGEDYREPLELIDDTCDP